MEPCNGFPYDSDGGGSRLNTWTTHAMERLRPLIALHWSKCGVGRQNLRRPFMPDQFSRCHSSAPTQLTLLYRSRRSNRHYE